MTKRCVLLVGLLLLVPGAAFSQQVVITDFPLGVGGSVGADFFKPYSADLKVIAAILQKDPLAQVVITGGADGVQYQRNNDAKNPGLALGRAHALRSWMIGQFGVDSAQVIVQSKDVAAKGPKYRSVSIRILEKARPNEPQVTFANSPAPQSQPADIRHMPDGFSEHMGLQVAAGVSSSPYGGIPVVSGAVTWKRIVYVEGIFGYTFWGGTYRFQNLDLDTRRRIAGGAIIVYPSRKLPIGVVGGWRRVEDLSQQYYAYVRLSEGPYIGLRASLFHCLSITGAYNPSRQRLAGESLSKSQDDNFLISVMLHKTFGGAR